LGVDRADGRLASFYCGGRDRGGGKLKYEMPEWLRVILGTAGGLTILAILIGGVLLFENAATDSTQGTKIGSLVRRNHRNAVELCQRSNDARVGSIKNLHSDVRTLRTQLRLWEASIAHSTPEQLAQTPQDLLEAFNKNLSALRSGIRRKRAAIRASIESQAEVAIKPGSPIVDCQKANSLARSKTPLPSPISRRSR
jgi:hypothetical protein